MSSTEPRAPGKPGAVDFVMWFVVGATMLICLLTLIRTADSSYAWAVFLPAIVLGALLAWRRWRFVRDRIPHI